MLIAGKELANSVLNAAGKIVKIGEDAEKKNLLDNVIPPFASQNHRTRTVHIHDLEYFNITYNCIGIKVSNLVGHALSFSHALRELSRKIVYLTNAQSGGIGFLDFDSDLKEYIKNESDDEIIWNFRELFFDLNTFSRKGCEKAYVTFNFGLDESENGRRVSKLLLKAYEMGDERGNPLVFPNLVFKLKNDVNVDDDSPNHDLYLQSLSVTSKRMVPTYFNCDTELNKSADPHKIGIMGCRTRVVSNLYGESSGLNRGNIACVTINLVQIAFESKGDFSLFYKRLDELMEQSKELLLFRFNSLVKNGDFSDFYQNQKKIYKDSNSNDNFTMLRNGTLSVGFIGVWDALSVMHKKIWQDIDDMRPCKDEALEIVSHMAQAVEKFKNETKMNFSLLASAAEGVSGSFAEYDGNHLGKGSETCEKGYYTNSFHVPVFVKADFMDKIDFEAPFHKLCNGGSITYVEMEEMPGKNVEAAREVVEYAYKKGCGYIGINFPLDNCRDCGFTGRISLECPKCKSRNIRRLRRVSGYLAEENKFTNGKRHEMKMRKSNFFEK